MAERKSNVANRNPSEGISHGTSHGGSRLKTKPAKPSISPYLPFSPSVISRSAMFNVLVIVALSAAVAVKSGASGIIDHRVVARDVCFYTCSILLLVLSASDGQIMWWEVSLAFRCPISSR